MDASTEVGKSDNNKMLNKLLKEAKQKRYSHLLIMGDFNYKDIMWNQDWSTPSLSENSEEFLFVETLRDCYLYQHIDKPTRTRVGQEPSILDLVITNEEGMVEGVEYLSLLGKSDHLVINFNLKCYIQQTKRIKEIYCHGKGNCTDMGLELMKINWNEELDNRKEDVNYP